MSQPEQPDAAAPLSNIEQTNSADADVAAEPLTRSSTQSSGRLRSASIKFLESNPPSGMWQATGNILAQAPTPFEIRRGDFGRKGWDAQIQRRNSDLGEESLARLSRQTSAQTPGTLARKKTNTLEAHPEVEDEGHPSQSAKDATTSMAKAPDAQLPPGTANDEDDPFSMFVGRGRIDSQLYTPKDKAALKAMEATANDGANSDNDDTDSLDDLDPRPKKRLSALPKKFTDPAGDAVPKPDEKPATDSDIKRLETRDGSPVPQGPDADGYYPTGYKFPPKHTWGEATLIGLQAFWKFTITPFGFLVVLYGLNVVAWGGMLFLLLIGGGDKYMCYPHDKPGLRDCNDLDAPRRIWIEIDSQILNALFCVTGFGLIPWRFRDLFYLLQFRLRKNQTALRRLGGIHRAWFRLPGSHRLPTGAGAIPNMDSNATVALPARQNPDPPLTGIRASDTKLWKLDYVIWAYVLNTFLQAVLSGFMWGLNRYDRPSWSTGLFVALACIVAGLGGLMSFMEGRRVKAVEGIPVKAEEILADAENQLQGKSMEEGPDEKRRRKRLSKSAPV